MGYKIRAGREKPAAELAGTFHHVQIPFGDFYADFTTKAIEHFNRQLGKETKTKSAFVSDDALMKILYLATMNITEK